MSNNAETHQKKIVIFASGSGTNAENIIRYFKSKKNIEVAAVFSNRRNAGALKKAHKHQVKALLFDRDAFYDTHDVLNVLRDMKPDLIVLAGFLWLMPSNIIREFRERIINIHPALLPKYGGKGMYGSRVHESVLENKESESGITIHYVDEKYDEGTTIFQERVKIEKDDNVESLTQKVHQLEYEHFPKVIEEILQAQA